MTFTTGEEYMDLRLVKLISFFKFAPMLSGNTLVNAQLLKLEVFKYLD